MRQPTKNSSFCLRKLTCFVAKWHLWSIFVQNFNLLVSKTKLHWLAQELERNSLLTRIFGPISLWHQKSFVLTSLLQLNDNSNNTSCKRKELGNTRNPKSVYTLLCLDVYFNVSMPVNLWQHTAQNWNWKVSFCS